MLIWSKARLVILALLLAAFTHIAYTRGLGWRLGGAPATLRGPYATEEAWVVGEISRDVAEMASFPKPVSAPPTVSLRLDQQLWSPEAFVPVVAAAAGSITATNATVPPEGGVQASARLQNSRHAVTSLTASDPAGTSYSSSMLAGKV